MEMEKYEDLKIKIPSLENNIISKHILNKLLRTSKDIIKTYSFIQRLNEFTNNYKFNYDESNKVYWIQELKDINFKTLQEAELYAFLDYCVNCCSQYLKD